MNKHDLKTFLDEKVHKYNSPDFIENDPIQIPHQFTQKEDIEIAGFLAATIAWGKRDLIIRSAHKLMSLMDHAPYQFITESSRSDQQRFESYYYRTFNAVDCLYFINVLQNIYTNNSSLEKLFTDGYKAGGITEAIRNFRTIFTSFNAPQRTLKHIANIDKGASAKRLNMYLRWMVRRDRKGVDFGIWKNIDPKDLLLPLDVHTGNVARLCGLLTRKQNDLKAVNEVMVTLREFDVLDPVKYDFALFGLGIDEHFK